MSLVTSSQASSNFGVKNQILTTPTNRAPPLVTGKIIKTNVGTTSAAIPPVAILGHTITVSPASASQIYTLPTASAILAEFGKSIDTGVPKLAAGDSHIIRIVNRGAAPAIILSNPTGGDGTAILAYTGSATGIGGVGFTGTVFPVGKLTTLYLEWLQVSGGVNGATGLYTIYQ
jgi:hypothetical protein